MFCEHKVFIPAYGYLSQIPMLEMSLLDAFQGYKYPSLSKGRLRIFQLNAIPMVAITKRTDPMETAIASLFFLAPCFAGHQSIS